MRFSVSVAGLGIAISLLLATMADRAVRGALAYKTVLLWPYAVAAAVAGLWALHTAKVSLDKDGDGFKVTRSALSLRAKVPGIAAAEFARIADDAKANCPISKLLNAEVTLERTLG